MNAIEHGGQFDPAKRVEITRVRTAGMLMYLVRDPGPGFDFANLPHAAVSSPGDSVRYIAYRDEHGMRAWGFGLLVAGGLVVELVHDSKGNQAVLIKYLSGQPQGHRSVHETAIDEPFPSGGSAHAGLATSYGVKTTVNHIPPSDCTP